MLVARYKTKKELRESIGQELLYLETSLFNLEYKAKGSFAVVGPSAYERRWFATVEMDNN